MMRFIRPLLLVIVFFTISIGNAATNKHEIKIIIGGDFQDTAVLLTSYFGERIKIIDTAYSLKKGEFVFSGKNKLAGGIYMVVSIEKKKLFEFVVGENQRFTLRTNKPDYTADMKVKGSDENKLFYKYLLYNEKQFNKNKQLIKEKDSLLALNEDVTNVITQQKLLKEETTDYKISTIDGNKGTFVSALLNSMREIEIPDSIKNSADSTLSYKYFKQHYWDYIDLSDSTLLRTPVYTRKIDRYFEQLVMHHPDSVISAIDLIIAKSRPSDEVTGYLVWYFLSEYQNPKYMGFDKVFVHLVDEYFRKETISNTTPSILESLNERADKIRPILLGKQAPNLNLIDTLGNFISFNNITSNYTVLFFWDSDCGICSKEIIELNKLYHKTDFDFEVFAINVNSDQDKWKKSIIEKSVPGINVNGTRSTTKDFHDLYDIYGTPVIYVLDKDKKIIAKRVGVIQLPELFEAYEKKQLYIKKQALKQ